MSTVDQTLAERGTRYGTFMDNARIVRDHAGGSHGIGVHDDANEAGVQPQSIVQMQDGQHGLRCDRHGHLIGHEQAPCAGKFFAREEQRRQLAQSPQ